LTWVFIFNDCAMPLIIYNSKFLTTNNFHELSDSLVYKHVYTVLPTIDYRVNTYIISLNADAKETTNETILDE